MVETKHIDPAMFLALAWIAKASILERGTYEDIMWVLEQEYGD